jgi:uracil permease
VEPNGVFDSVILRGFLQVIPILISVVVGYLLAFFPGMVDTVHISNDSWIAIIAVQGFRILAEQKVDF